MSLPETMGPGTTRWRCALMLLINNNCFLASGYLAFQGWCVSL